MEEMEAKEKKKRLYLNVAWLVCSGWLCAVVCDRRRFLHDIHWSGGGETVLPSGKICPLAP